MNSIEQRAGAAALGLGRRAPLGSYDEEGGMPRFRIRDYDSMPPFLMSVASEGDHWLFVSSSGALTAGRGDPDRALFPYRTDDQIHDAADRTGSKTLIRVERGGREGRCGTCRGTRFLWEPFSPRYAGIYRITRTLSKSAYGHEVEFEERNEDLRLTFSYSWSASGEYGFLRRASLTNDGDGDARIEMLDGLLDIMPAGLSRRFQSDFSTLADGYRDSELVAAAGVSRFLALYRLSSIPTDRAEPSEALRANTVWSIPLEGGSGGGPTAIYLRDAALDAFRSGESLEPETRVRGRRGAYLERSDFVLEAGKRRSWVTVADQGADAARVLLLLERLGAADGSGSGMGADLRRDAERSLLSLRRVVGCVDGFQRGSDLAASWRHYSNALYNAMRGGFPVEGYAVRGSDLASFVGEASAAVAARRSSFLSSLPETLGRDELVSRARATGDPDLERIAREYLPFAFSRRHGDPSRPWNSFSIAPKDASGRRILGYEGNWRDIFQNWEALALSYPGYIDGMIFKFLDASTADGYNPYRITRSGIEWEVIDEADAWSFIGYWGDHQAAYLLRLLEASARYRPGELAELLGRRIFAYAQVPYRVKDYASMLSDPRRTVDFDAALHGWIIERSKALGGDGKLLRAADGSPCRACLAEKLLVSVLAKLSSFVPDGGVWMNTQRPEWNDANNALVGYGLSVVTLCHLRCLVSFCRGLFSGAAGTGSGSGYEISVEVARLARRIGAALASSPPAPGEMRCGPGRKALMDALGEAGSDYRTGLYEGGLSGVTEPVAGEELVALCDIALIHIDHSLRANRRPDGLYHAYNLMLLEEGAVGLRRLPVMLEGQAAILGSGILGASEAADLLEALRASALYRSDQDSYLLYPDRILPSFLEKNRVPSELAASSALLARLEEGGDGRIGGRDGEGRYRFNADFKNASDLDAVLRDLASSAPRCGAEIARLAEEERELVLGIYEKVFDHHSFTGRSGTFYKYEGLGSVYWHMVSKLLLATAECLDRARGEGADGNAIGRLESAYRGIRAGLGTHKSPADYGAFPSDPYSHTPSFAGAQQPGMTGQVKEDLISRFAELGASVREGRLSFRPSFASREEALAETAEFSYFDASGEERSAELPRGSYAFTICQVLVVAHRGEDGRRGKGRIEIARRGGRIDRVEGLELDDEESERIFGRSLETERLDLFFGDAYYESERTRDGQ